MHSDFYFLTLGEMLQQVGSSKPRMMFAMLEDREKMQHLSKHAPFLEV